MFSPSADPDDYAVLNQGQLKNLAAAAVAEMNEILLPEGAGLDLNGLINSWQNPSVTRADYAAVNVGQLKALAALFYDQLEKPYPWASSGPPADDYALANIGQAKTLFSFSIQFDPPQDWFDWLAQEGLPANTPLNARSDPNGPTNWEKFKEATQDTDGDGSPDVNEIANGTNPTEKDNPAANLVAYAYALP